MSYGKARKLFCKFWLPHQDRFKYRWVMTSELMCNEELFIQAVELMQKSMIEGIDYLEIFLNSLGIETNKYGPGLTAYVD